MKGMSAVSEALMALGVVVVSIMFVLVAGNIISFQTGQTTLTTQDNIPKNIRHITDTMSSMDQEVYFTFESGLDTYTLTVEKNTFLTMNTPQKDVNSTAFISGNISIPETNISNSEYVCITKKNEDFFLNEGVCE